MKVGSAHPILSMKFLINFLKFAIVGVLNTAVTYFLYLLLLLFSSYLIAYSLAYLTGIIISYLLNSKYVFKESISPKKFLMFPLVYIVQYVMSSLLLYLSVHYLNVNERIALLISIVLTTPITFVLSKRIISNPKKSS